MAKAEKNKGKVLDKLKNKYRLVVLNDNTFEEKVSFRLSRLNVFVVVGFGAIFLIAGTVVLIAFTPIKEYIPGYSSSALKREAFNNALAVDSLEKKIASNDLYIANIKRIMNGEEPESYISDDLQNEETINSTEIDFSISEQDSALRARIEEEERYNINSSNSTSSLSGFAFFTPVKGSITNGFDSQKKHYALDIAAAENESVKSVLDGTIIFSEWTAETGHVIIIQHTKELLSVYKHNSVSLKGQGAFVKAGEVIAIVGNSGEYTSGTHLHFELWHRGNPVNPENFIAF